MPRIRALKPETPQDEKLASVSREARLTFLYSLTLADDDGLFRANPRQLLGQLYPFDGDVSEPQLAGWIQQLVGIGLLKWRETKDGAPVLEICNFSKHQHITKRSKSFLLNQLVDRPVTVEKIPVTPEKNSVRSLEVLKSRSPEVLSPETLRDTSPETQQNEVLLSTTGSTPSPLAEPAAGDTWGGVAKRLRVAIETHLAPRHPEGWDLRRDMSLAKAALKHGLLPDEVEAAIRGLPKLVEGTLTLRLLYSPAKGGEQPLYRRAIAAGQRSEKAGPLTSALREILA